MTAQLWQMRHNNPGPNDANNTKNETLRVLITRNVKESRQTLRYNFRSDAMLHDLYVDHRGNVLIGRLFEDLDALAGSIAFSHCGNSDPNIPSRLSLVTASVDKIIQTKAISVANDIIVIGQVAFVGKSSLDIAIEIHTADDSGKFPGC